MKITILKEKLKEGVGIVERIATKSLSLPILNNILMVVEKNFLSLAATDLEISIKWWSLVKTEREGQIVIPSKIFSGFIGFLPSKPVRLAVKDTVLRVECDNYQSSIKGLSPDDFPIIPQVATEEKILTKSQLFCQALSQVVDFSSNSSAKPEISGIFFQFQKNLLTMTATDSFRLGEKKIYLDSSLVNTTKDYSFILPQKTAREIINIFGEREGDLAIYFSPNQILFETSIPETPHPQIQLTSRLIEGEYPNYQEIVPKKYDTCVTVQASEFLNQVKLASLFSGKINEIKLSIDPTKGRIDLFSQSPDLGEYHGFLAGKVEGKPCEISFNYRFLLDGLLSVCSGREKASEVVLELTSSEKPGVIRPRGDESFLYLVMPIKI